jgi:DNA-binding NarL/FixJ family response regulator
MLQILLADDHELMRRGIRDVLETQEGWIVCGEAGEGHLAVALAQELEPDVAIVDFAIPVLDGLEVTRRIRRASPRTHVLMFSGHDSEELANRARGAGALAYVVKSNPAELLVHAVATVATGATYFRPVGALRNEVVQPGRIGRGGSTLGKPLLTPRESEIAELLAAGKTNWCVATILGISVKTVETHRANIMQKLGLESIVELVHYAVRNHMVKP